MSQQVSGTSEAAAPQESEDAAYHWLGDSWAQWLMAGFALAATVVSLRGLYLLRLTFEETAKTAEAAKDAADIAREAMEIEHRPWLALDDLQITKVYLSQGRLRIFARIRAANLGKSPAIGVTFQSQALIAGSKRLAANPTLTEYCEHASRSVERPSNIVIFPSKDHVVGGQSVVGIAGELYLIVPTATPGAVSGTLSLRLRICVTYNGTKYTGMEVALGIPQALLRTAEGPGLDVSQIVVSASRNVAALK